MWLRGKETFLSLEGNCIQLYIEMWLSFTDVTQYHSKFCGPLFPPSSTSDMVHQYHNNMAGSEILWEVWNELTPNKKPNKITVMVKVIHLTRSFPFSSLPLATLHFFTLAHPLSGGPPILGHSLTVRNTLPDSLFSLLLSQALCRPVPLFFSGLCNTNHTSKTQLRGPSLHCFPSTCCPR